MQYVQYRVQKLSRKEGLEFWLTIPEHFIPVDLFIPRSDGILYWLGDAEAPASPAITPLTLKGLPSDIHQVSVTEFMDYSTESLFLGNRGHSHFYVDDVLELLPHELGLVSCPRSLYLKDQLIKLKVRHGDVRVVYGFNDHH